MLRVRELSDGFELRHRSRQDVMVGVFTLMLGLGSLAAAYVLALGGLVPAFACPTLAGVSFGLLGWWMMTAGSEVLLRVQQEGTRVAALSRLLRADELQRVEVRVRGKEVDMVLVLSDQRVSLSTVAMRHHAPDELARRLGSALKVPVDVCSVPNPSRDG